MKNLKELLLEGRMKTKFPEWYKDCKVDYDGQLYFKAWFYAELLNRNIKSKEEVNKLMKDDLFYFDDFDYVALGHIHGPQKVGRESIRYCGTPLKYLVFQKLNLIH